MNPDAQVVVFAGPSLHGLETVASTSGAAPGASRWGDRCAFWPPAGRGDVLRALATQPRGLVLLDGYFHRVPAVTHQELLYALDSGVPVVGAASMGALRAAELERFGMTGVGRIFAAYRDGVLDGDDEVALLHAPAEFGYAPIGVPLVEVRFALERLAGELGVAGSGAAAVAGSGELLAALKALAFSERSRERVTELADRWLGAELGAGLQRQLESASVKREDACAAIEFGLSAAAPAPPRQRAPTGYLTCFKELYLPAPGAAAATVARALQAALVLHPQAPELVRAVRRRALHAAAAAAAGAAIAEADLEARAQELRTLHAREHGGAFLPAAEYRLEARLELLAAHPEAGAGLAALARRFGCEFAIGSDAGGGDRSRSNAEAIAASEALVAVAEAQPDLLPAWDLARAFAFAPAFGAAAATATTAGAVLACLLRSSAGARVREDALHRFAAELWRCEPTAIPAEAARRGLFPAAGLADGLREALELMAPAERLPTPINDYPAARARLIATPLQSRC